MQKYKHLVVYIGRSSVFTDKRFTDKLKNALRTHEEHGWELVSTSARSGPLGDVSGIWIFFKRLDEASTGKEGARQLRLGDAAEAA